MRYLVLLLGLFLTGPALWYLLDAVQHGPSTSNLPMMIASIGLYTLWCGVVWRLRPAPGEHFELGCFLLLASGGVVAALFTIAAYLPLPPDTRSIKDVGLLLLAYFPWLLLQYALFVVVWAASQRVDRSQR